MNIAFRVDSSSKIGVGHLRRCLKLAEDLKHRCRKIIFITKNLNGNFNNLIKKKKFKFVLIKNIISKKRLETDLKDTKDVCKKFEIDTLILDHYFLGLDWEKSISKYVNKLVIIDDFSKKKHYCDLIINNLNNNNFTRAKHLNGLRYVIVPNNFNYTRKKKAKNTIGTFFGSTDSLNCTERLLKMFSDAAFKKFQFISILGKNNRRKKEIKNNFKIYKNISIENKFINMKNFFKKIDVLFTVGGVTSFEALCNNVKCIYIPINHYQKATCNFLKQKNISDVISYSKIFSNKGKKLLINCLTKIYNKKKFSNNFLNIDHLGSKRIADYILSKQFNIK